MRLLDNLQVVFICLFDPDLLIQGKRELNRLRDLPQPTNSIVAADA
jgi:hypothetical protein